MKASKYNFYFEDNNKYYIFNQLTTSFCEFDESLYNALKYNENLEDISNEDIKLLDENHFICTKSLEEENIILRRNRIYRYSNNVAKLTIMPTLNCNFKCWYCYESHIESRMNDEIINSTILFIRSIIEQKKIKVFVLDWFGGEPLLYFEEVMEPIAKATLELCLQNNIQFVHGITTNGYLIDKDIAVKMNQLRLTNFQITLDGNVKFHNKTRFSETDKNTYGTIVSNIETLCKNIENINMTVRINYTPKNISTIEDIATSFKKDIRDKIRIMPQIVWQYKKDINNIDDTIHEKLEVFKNEGYNVNGVFLPSPTTISCYVENTMQYVINYDGEVYKCTARDFKKENSIGYIDPTGKFIPNPVYYKYFTSSFFENPKCLACEVLPSCYGMCLQKKIENKLPSCPYESVYISLKNQLKLILAKDPVDQQ